jgi:CelD/BcsL family acetyltransferase involved in cellulose biosynthesis
MTIASIADSASAGLADAAEARALPFAAVETHVDFEHARAAWGELEAVCAGAYQTLAFARAWAATLGRWATPMIVVARDAAGRPVALLPLYSRRLGPLKVARFIGGPWANYQFGLFRSGADWRAGDVEALLKVAAGQKGVDLFAFSYQPLQWEGAANPLALLPSRPGPDVAFATTLRGTHAAWIEAHFSRATQKKMRKKTRKLEAFGAVYHRRAETESEAEGFLKAFLAHRADHAKARDEPNPFAGTRVVDLLRRLALGPKPILELHALLAGERIAAVFGAMAGGPRLSGLIISYEADPEIAAATPGELLLSEVARHSIGRGLQTLDLGAGASRYKSSICEIEEPLLDSGLGVTVLGELAASAYLLWRSALGAVKRRPRLLRLAKRFRGSVNG